MKKVLCYLLLVVFTLQTSPSFAGTPVFETSTSITVPVKKDKKVKKEKTRVGKFISKMMSKLAGDVDVAAALLALFLGSFGAHAFYLGDKSKGWLMLGLTLACLALVILGFVLGIATGGIGFILSWIGSIGLFAMGIWAFVDFIRILTGNYRG